MLSPKNCGAPRHIEQRSGTTIQCSAPYRRAQGIWYRRIRDSSCQVLPQREMC